MRQRVGIAQAPLGRLELLTLDEPTVGLDVEERLNFRRMLSELLGRPTVLLSTHILSDLEGARPTVSVVWEIARWERRSRQTGGEAR